MGRSTFIPMLRFRKAHTRWWRKPLVSHNGRELPAELAILDSRLGPSEHGVWLNSRSYAAGVADLIRAEGKFATRRAPVPDWVESVLGAIHKAAGVSKGCPDLVIWNTESRTFRLIEVKCPHWDRPSSEQESFMKAAAAAGIMTEVAEWEFEPDAP